ncbi:23S rRNA (uracil(1939)-C(5))-methyltransferase RlmD [Alphaproteobacteria bacterium]|nr:23S rRNA (uracil(1939)-C(5))-methyltransferase RlmD [Alphaproteobacteria bacterium]
MPSQCIQKQITIHKINSSGEGVSFEDRGKTILVPFTLPGEEVEVSLKGASKGEMQRAYLKKVIVKSPYRKKAPCPYFESCGGCQLQHLDESFYKEYKKQLVTEAFQKNKLEDSVVLDPILMPSGVRRRINFKVVKKNKEILLGFHRRRSHEILDIKACLLLLPEFKELMNSLRDILPSYLKEGEGANIFLTKISNGFDGMISFEQQKKISFSQKESLLQWASKSRIIKLMLTFPKGEELLVQQEAPEINFSGTPVLFPSQSFLQTSKEAEDLMVKRVVSLLPSKHKKIVDLFSGLGTFSFPLAQKGCVDAFESHHKAVQYFNVSAQKNKFPHTVKATQRDLFLYPLSAEEFNAYDVVVLDPPRAGAVNQIKQLMVSKVKHIIMVSCNANTFARDARLLVGSGYQMGETHLIDQFLWSPHVELISSFSRL